MHIEGQRTHNERVEQTEKRTNFSSNAQFFESWYACVMKHTRHALPLTPSAIELKMSAFMPPANTMDHKQHVRR